jgi:hypothetical protein
VGRASGPCEWAVRVGRVSGPCEWAVRVGSASKQVEWAVRMGSASKMKVTHKVVVGSLKAGCHSEDPRIEGKIILKLFLDNIKIAFK